MSFLPHATREVYITAAGTYLPGELDESLLAHIADITGDSLFPKAGAAVQRQGLLLV